MKIVVAFNSLNPRSHSLIEAEEWGRTRGAELFLIHVMESEYSSLYWDTEGVGTATVEQTMMYEQDQVLFEEMAKKLTEELAIMKERGISVSGEVTRGDPAVEILEKAKESGADMIIVGTHKHEGFQGGIYKSVIEKATCPVLVIPTLDK